ncbi:MULTISPECIES: hypothetical protein [Mycobacterium]|uniref:hypothetical protein n=1 Tax=Mycobacterium TaxID=1763 RepID=UPI00055B2687|nr:MULTISPECIES: hypothetical protein [Mycobacterium]OCB19233.1 hypothetical protein A5644_20435 [Mycobacterium intracellulare subsp. yongonense]
MAGPAATRPIWLSLALELPLVVIIVVIIAMVLVSNWLSHITIRIHEPDWAGNRAPAPTT